jgi:cytochrome c6
MKKLMIAVLVGVMSLASAYAFAKETGKAVTGEELFKQNCAVCHPDGGNIINPEFTLRKKDRDAHGVKNVSDIISRMRNPGPGMTKFDTKTISDADAKKIAEYILKTFK